jgi:signal transduction histidine kinase
MTTVPRKLLTALDRGRDLAGILEQTKDNPASRVARLTELLYAAWPSALSACFLNAEPVALGCVLDATGRRQPAWEEALRDPLTLPADQADREPVRAVPWPSGMEVQDQTLAGAPVEFRAHRYGTLALAIPERDRLDATSPAVVLLTRWAEHLAMLLYLEDQERLREDLQSELARQAGLCMLGELTGLVGHDFNNALNSIVLHVAVIGLDAPEKVRTELGVIRQLATNAAGQVRKLQQFSRQQRPTPQPVDLNRLVRAAAQKAQPQLRIDLDLAAELPLVLGTEADLRRILTLLLAHSAAAMAPGPGRITLQTRKVDKRAVLRLEDTGPGVADDSLAQLFEPFVVLRPGGNGSDLPICKALVRRLQGSMQAENRPQGGVAFVIELPMAPATELPSAKR